MTHGTDAGVIQEFDQGARTVTLQGGQNYSLAPDVDATAWRAGDYVHISYDEAADHTRIADAVVKSSPEREQPPAKPAIKVTPMAPKPVVNTTSSFKASAHKS